MWCSPITRCSCCPNKHQVANKTAWWRWGYFNLAFAVLYWRAAGRWLAPFRISAYGTSYAKAGSWRLPFILRSRSSFGRNLNNFNDFICVGTYQQNGWFLSSCFKKFFPKLRLANDGLERAYLDFTMIRYWNSYSLSILFFLHNDMTSLLTDLYKPAFIEDFAYFFSWKYF